MTYPLTTGTSLVSDLDYNQLFDIVTEVLGVGEDGWGLYNFQSLPISSSNLVRATEWLNLQRDLIDRAYFHITNTTTVLTEVTPAVGNAITAKRHNEYYQVAQYVLANRFTCAEGQYFRDLNNGSSICFINGISSRTIEWGINENYIEHRVRVRWANRLIARHFFNGGGQLTWNAYHGNNGLNDIDTAWAVFISSIYFDQLTNPIIYDRAAFINQTPGTTTTLYPGVTGQLPGQPTYVSGTLSITVELFKANSEDWVEFIITFANSNSATLIVTPSVGYWNSTI